VRDGDGAPRIIASASNGSVFPANGQPGVLLQEGHVLSRREVAVPIGAVTGVEDGVQLNITKQQVENLPAVNTDHLSG
jgi:hypothetical protein